LFAILVHEGGGAAAEFDDVGSAPGVFAGGVCAGEACAGLAGGAEGLGDAAGAVALGDGAFAAGWLGAAAGELGWLAIPDAAWETDTHKPATRIRIALSAGLRLPSAASIPAANETNPSTITRTMIPFQFRFCFGRAASMPWPKRRRSGPFSRSKMFPSGGCGFLGYPAAGARGSVAALGSTRAVAGAEAADADAAGGAAAGIGATIAEEGTAKAPLPAMGCGVENSAVEIIRSSAASASSSSFTACAAAGWPSAP